MSIDTVNLVGKYMHFRHNQPINQQPMNLNQYPGINHNYQLSSSTISNSRGQLIVIKIQIDQTRTDRIFLHQNDDDYQIAGQFAKKHSLPYNLIGLIHGKIEFSRKSIKEQSCGVMGTPIQNLQSWRKQDRSVRRGEVEYQELFDNHKRNNENKGYRDGGQVECTPQHVDRQFKFYDQSPQKQYPQSYVAMSQFDKIQNILQTKDLHTKINFQQSNSKNNLQSTSKKLSLPQSNSKLNLHQTNSRIKFNQTNTKVDIPLTQPIQINLTDSLAQSGKTQGSLAGKIKIISGKQMASLHASLGRSDSKRSLGRSLSKQDLSKINKQVTNRLYNQSQIKNNYLKLLKQKAVQQQQISNDPELTHRPSINRLSKIIAQGRKQPSTRVQQHLMKYGKQNQLKKQQKAKIRCMAEIEDCSFAPVINIISQRLNAQKQGEVKYRKSHVQQVLFQPQINPISVQLMKQKGCFEQRQRQFLQNKNSRLMERVKQQQITQKYDTVSGQELFKPKINDMGLRQQLGNNIGEYLYQKRKGNRVVSQPQYANPKINQKSQKMVKFMNLRRISWLFSELDSDQDGRISAQSIQISTIQSPLLQIIKPILFQMQEMGQSLTLMEFKAAIQCLHAKLNADQKSVLYNYKQPKGVRC